MGKSTLLLPGNATAIAAAAAATSCHRRLRCPMLPNSNPLWSHPLVVPTFRTCRCRRTLNTITSSHSHQRVCFLPGKVADMYIPQYPYLSKQAIIPLCSLCRFILELSILTGSHALQCGRNHMRVCTHYVFYMILWRVAAGEYLYSHSTDAWESIGQS